MNTGDILALAYRTVRSNKLRTGLTVAIIAFGIMALVGIITAIKAMNQKFSESFSTMGANGFTIRYKGKTNSFWWRWPIRFEGREEGKKKGKDFKSWKSDHR
jgi:putative ABC transport system permease protein